MGAGDTLAALRGGLVVSCQALEGEPLYTEKGGVMPLFARAAQQAGAVGIRANGTRDIAEIKAEVHLPVIGIIKRGYDGGEQYITVSMREIDELVAVGCDIIALDCTLRPRYDGLTMAEHIAAIKTRYPEQLLMADIARFEEGVAAAEAGVDLVGTTLSGYTPQSEGAPAPNVELVRRLAAEGRAPVVAEGQVHLPEQARAMIDAGAHCVVVGGAITRPLEIARRFVAALDGPAAPDH